MTTAPMIVGFTPAGQLVTSAAPARAVEFLDALRRLYLARRGESATPLVPRTQHDDAIDLVNAFAGLVAPIDAALAHALPALWSAWRRSYAAVFELVAAAPNQRAPISDPAALWLGMLAPFAREVAAFARIYPTGFLTPATN